MTTRGRASIGRSKRAGAARKVLVAFAGLLLVYVSLVNILINSDWFEELCNSRPGRVQVEWDSIWTWFPGHISLKNVRLRTQSLRVQSLVHAERASGWISFPSLRARTIRLFSVRITDLTSEVRSASMLRKAEPKEIRYFPVIPGFEPLTPESAREFGPFRPGWQVRISDAKVTGTHRLALGNYEISGTGTAFGEVSYRNHEKLEISGGSLSLSGTRVRVNGEELVSGVASGRFTVHEFEPYLHPGLAKAPFISFDLDIEGRLASLDVVNFYLGVERDSNWPGLSAGGGISGRLAVERG
ncbi:MAG: hypothetical protein DWQ08_02635, partial [Proteobacteria bacterium]